MLFSKKLKACCYTESGRSMIEMLGVLAIVGVLSIAGIAGYEFAVLKFRTNEIINELNGRAISISSLLLNDKHTYVPEEVIEDGFGDTLSIGYGVESVLSDRNSNYFEISVMDVPSDVCVQLLKSYENPIMIFADEVSYNNDTSICHSESGVVDMDFIYRNDLGEHDKCSARGYFGEEDFKCHCSGNTYIDPDNPKECLCPAGHVWDAETGEHGDCIESICPEGYFESLENGCVPCSDEETYRIATDDRHKALCTASSCGRITIGSKCVNVTVNNCVPGTTFRSSGGKCYSCDYAIGTEIGKEDSERKLCTDCGRVIETGYHMSNWPYCVSPTMCEKGKEFIYDDTASSGRFQCKSCSGVIAAIVPLGDVSKSFCEACPNMSYVKIDALHAKCVKTTCETGEFMGADGQCYPCSEPQKIAVNTGSGCSSTTCGRVEVTGTDGKTYCQIANCPTDGTHANVNGSCYPCSSYFESTKAQCDQCTSPTHLWNGNESDGPNAIGRCMKACVYGKQYPSSQFSDICYGCTAFTWGEGIASPLKTEVEKRYCDACSDAHRTDSNYCVANEACTKGNDVRRDTPITSYKLCVSCDLVDRIKIGTHELEREVCSACTTTPRFWVGAYCYRCDTAETPDVTTDEERASCLSCTGVRKISDDGKCVLIQ